MKKHLITILTVGLFSLSALGAVDHKHAKAVSRPKGGKILEVDSSHIEFFIQSDRKVSVTFLTEDMKPLPPAEQSVSLVAQAPSGKATLEFEKSGDSFISKTPLPEGDGYMTILQLKPKPDAKSQNLRIKLDLAECKECKHAEYACVCEEHGH